jgi:hypothetical protein
LCKPIKWHYLQISLSKLLNQTKAVLLSEDNLTFLIIVLKTERLYTYFCMNVLTQSST